ncbi:MAG: homoserine dehydrogenase [Desulfobacterales bacterium]
MTSVNIGLLGCGTVGTGVARILIDNADILKRRVGADLTLRRVADIDTETDRGVAFPEGVFIDDGAQVVSDPDIHIVVEMIGGEGIAKTLMLEAIRNGKHVVTANKALLAKHGAEVFEAAAAAGVDLAYEASVGGCMPVIKTLRESLAGNRIESATGILNGTCNYILTRITDEGISFEDALKMAQALGFAEADPTLDVEGFDTAHKLAIITQLAFGTPVAFEDLFIEGITHITPMDIDYARQFGFRIKLLAICKAVDGGVEARVHPTMIDEENLLSKVSGSINALTITGDAVGDVMLYGHGAGMMPTASAVVSDIVDITRNRMIGCDTGRVPLLSFQPESRVPLRILPMDEITTHYYLRIHVLDRPGVLSRISGILGESGISIQSVHQKGRKTRGPVPIVMMTHRAREADMQKALNAITDMDVVAERPVLIRVEDESND